MLLCATARARRKRVFFSPPPPPPPSGFFTLHRLRARHGRSRRGEHLLSRGTLLLREPLFCSFFPRRAPAARVDLDKGLKREGRLARQSKERRKRFLPFLIFFHRRSPPPSFRQNFFAFNPDTSRNHGRDSARMPRIREQSCRRHAPPASAAVAPGHRGRFDFRVLRR